MEAIIDARLSRTSRSNGLSKRSPSDPAGERRCSQSGTPGGVGRQPDFGTEKRTRRSSSNRCESTPVLARFGGSIPGAAADTSRVRDSERAGHAVWTFWRSVAAVSGISAGMVPGTKTDLFVAFRYVNPDTSSVTHAS